MDNDLNLDSIKQTNQVLLLNLIDQKTLYAAYMPFIKEGALFVKTDKQFQLDEEVFMLLKLLDEPEKIMLQGKVVWITPFGAEHKKTPGVGIQLLGENAKDVRNKIETALAGFNPSIEGSDTF